MHRLWIERFVLVMISLIFLYPPVLAREIKVAGKVTNVTVGKSTGVSMIISQSGPDQFRTVGSYDGKNLFGRFDVPGKLLISGLRYSCLQFQGDIEIGGNDGSGWPEGTKSAYVMSIYFTRKNAKGVYHIAKLGGLDFDQYGTMDLSSHHLIPGAKAPTPTSAINKK